MSKEKWKFSSTLALGSPVIADGKVYVLRKAFYSVIYCLDAEGNPDGTTDVIWEYDFDEVCYSMSPTIADNKLYLTTVDYGNDLLYVYCFRSNEAI